MAVVGSFYFSIFRQLTWKFLGFESERGGSVCWLNNKIIDLGKASAASKVRSLLRSLSIAPPTFFFQKTRTDSGMYSYGENSLH